MPQSSDTLRVLQQNGKGKDEMPKTIEFNTGRMYTAHGQIIKATLHDDGTVTFFDHSRKVDGQFKLGLHCSFTETEVMHWYDSDMAHGTPRSWADGMMRGGCNTL